MTVLVVAELVQIEPLLRDAVASSGLIVHDREPDSAQDDSVGCGRVRSNFLSRYYAMQLRVRGFSCTIVNTTLSFPSWMLRSWFADELCKGGAWRRFGSR